MTQKLALHFTLIFCSMLMALTQQSCAPVETSEVNITETLTSEGPYFSGANSFMSDYKVDLNNLVSEKTIEAENISSVKLNEAVISIPEGGAISFDQFVSATLQMVSDDLSMTTIAILNPLPMDQSNTIKLVVSESAELGEYFKEPNFTILLDLDFKEDDYSEAMSFDLDLTLNVEHK